MNKLDYLAQKEEELRQLNEKLEERMQKAFNLDSDRPLTSSKQQKLDDSLEEEKQEQRNVFDQDEEEDEIDSAQMLIQAEAIQDSVQSRGLRNSEQEFDQALTEVERYREVLDRCKEQEKIISFQKAKISALESELIDSVKGGNKNELRVKDLEAQNFKLVEDARKYSEKQNQATTQIEKLKAQNKEVSNKLQMLDKTISEQNKEIDAVERDKKRTVQDVGTKDAKLNRAIEEMERMKLQLKEAKSLETGKTDTLRKDLDRMMEENRKLERQRNELLQAFKKQMKLIDILKRQKMHIESAKLLAFTEDEFVKTLELGDKM